MIDSPVNFSHWHTEPALIGGLLFSVDLCLLVGTFRQNLPVLPIPQHTFGFHLVWSVFIWRWAHPWIRWGEFSFSAT